MPQGTVKFFRQADGYGFIKPDNGGNDVFVHIIELAETGLSHLAEGQKVTFDVGPGKRTGRPRAVNVRIAE
jgi:CspA family cold shock protein